MKTIFGLLIAVFSFNTWASDSAWLLCNDGNLALNVYEHRAGADTRETNLTLIYGGYVYQAVMSTDDPSSQPDRNGFQSVYINGPKEDQEFYSGQIKIDYVKQTVILKGQAVFGDTTAPEKVDTTLKCKELGGSNGPL